MFIRKRTLLLLLLVASATFAYPAFAQYTPMVRIPGLTAAGSINLSMYLVGLYNFMVSIVGIVAVMMMIVGGMRYITAAGSSTAISDAKDIISNAVAGLVIAIFAWIIVAAINPDVLFIKKPGSGFKNASYLSCTKQYTAAICKCNDDVGLGVFASPTACNDACKAGNHCGGLVNSCIRDGVNETTSPKFNTAPNNGKCLCANGVDVVPIPPATCQATCAIANCIKADARIGNTGITGFVSGVVDQKRTTIYIKNPCTDSLAFDAYKTFAVNPYTCSWDFESDGTPDNPSCFTGFCPVSGVFIAGTYTATLTVTDSVTGASSADTVIYEAIYP
ncbi:MAG: pilin [Candidatus Paceibacterota bacterium]|jgi:hypothetical protein